MFNVVGIGYCSVILDDHFSFPEPPVDRNPYWEWSLALYRDDLRER